MKSTGAQSSHELQWLDRKIGYQDSNSSNSHQDDMPYFCVIFHNQVFHFLHRQDPIISMPPLAGPPASTANQNTSFTHFLIGQKHKISQRHDKPITCGASPTNLNCHVESLGPDCDISSKLSTEIPQSWAKPSLYSIKQHSLLHSITVLPSHTQYHHSPWGILSNI